MTKRTSHLIVPAEADAEIVVCDDGLSFWGGVDPDTGVVIDAHHSLHGLSLAGKIVVMPTSRGSCSGSGVLLQLALNGHAPAVLVFREDEEVLTLGALIAAEMFGRSIGVVRLQAEEYQTLAQEKRGYLIGDTLVVGSQSILLGSTDQADLTLTTEERDMLVGAAGQPVALAMKVIVAMAASQGAKRLVPVTRGHIDGCIYAHEANLIFAETMADMRASVRVPTTINAISVDRENWTDHDLAPDFGNAASRLGDAYVRMGAKPTFTCAPYLADDVPQMYEDIGWSESNAVIYANSVLGARTTKHPDYLDLFVAMTGRAPETGVYLDENRVARRVIDVELPPGCGDEVWPLLGWIAGRMAPDRVPLLRGVGDVSPTNDDLRAVCAAFGTTSAAPLLHVAGVTPEGELEPSRDADNLLITIEDFVSAWRAFNTGGDRVDLIALGSPHFSLNEVAEFARLIGGRKVNGETSVIVTLGRDIFAKAETAGWVALLKEAGVQFYSDLCWCSIVEPIFPTHTKTLMTNSGKYAHYAPGLSGRTVRFGSLADCAEAAATGRAPSPPDWVTQTNR